MPKQTRSQALGREGERWFSSALPSNWLLQPPLEDIGVDGVVVICENGPLNGMEFRVQVKASRSWAITSDALAIRRLQRDAVLYWLTGFTPTLLVVYDAVAGRGYCDWVNRLAAPHQRLLRGRGKSLTFHIPLTRQITPEIWTIVGHELRALNGMVSRRVISAGKALPLLRVLHAMSEALHGLDFAANATKDGRRPQGDDLTILWQLELSCHRDVILALQALDGDMMEAGYQLEGLSHFIAEYIEKFATIVPSFASILANPDLLQNVQVDVAALSRRREGFMRSIVHAMRQLTAIGLNIVPENHGTQTAG